MTVTVVELTLLFVVLVVKSPKTPIDWVVVVYICSGAIVAIRRIHDVNSSY